MNLMIIKPEEEGKVREPRLDDILDKSLKAVLGGNDSAVKVIWVRTAMELDKRLRSFEGMCNQKLLFAITLGDSGVNMEWYSMLRCIQMYPRCFEGCTAGILVDGNQELYTKSAASEAVFRTNLSGCLFVGRPLVEGTKSLQNFKVTAVNLGSSLLEAYLESARLLIKRVLEFQPLIRNNPRILCLHASQYETSNTLSVWRMVRENLEEKCKIQEISLQNGEIYDCLGCPYHICLHYSQSKGCFYGGAIVKEVYPAVESCDILLMLCPNYNDALGANLTAFINRLTALFRKRQFYDKYIFAIVVSGYSGGDLIARQLISSLNMNKTFILPGNFALLETANDPGSIYQVEGIEKKAEEFANRIYCRAACVKEGKI